MEAAPRLRAVDPATGEVSDTAPQTLGQALELIDYLGRQLDGAQTEIRSWRTRYSKLKEDKDAEAREDPLWDRAVALFLEWRIATGKIRSQWTSDRFWLCRRFLDCPDGFRRCRYAVWGIAAAPNRKMLWSGYYETYQDWELVFRNAATFERYVRRGWALFDAELPQEPL
jgi:hypothetical protein